MSEILARVPFKEYADELDYTALLAELIDEIKPVKTFERFWVRDIARLTQEIFVLEQALSQWIQLRKVEAAREILAPGSSLLVPGGANYKPGTLGYDTAVSDLTTLHASPEDLLVNAAVALSDRALPERAIHDVSQIMNLETRETVERLIAGLAARRDRTYEDLKRSIARRSARSPQILEAVFE